MKKDSYFKWFYVLLIGILSSAINYGFRELPEVLFVLNVLVVSIAAYKLADNVNYIQSMLSYIDNLSRQVQQETPQQNQQPTVQPVVQTPSKPRNPVGFITYSNNQ